MLNILKSTSFLGFLICTNTLSALAQPVYPTIQKAGFLFEFQKCQVTPNSNLVLVCAFLLQNSNQARRLVFYPGSSQFIDSGGNVVKSSGIQIGDKASTDRVVSDELVQGIPVKGIVVFGEEPKGGIRLITLQFSITSNIYQNPLNGKLIDLTLDPKYFNVEFRF